MVADGPMGEDATGSPAGSEGFRLSASAAVLVIGVSVLTILLAFADGARLASPPRSYALFEGRGFRVTTVVPGDVFDRAGIRPGDLVVAFQGEPLASSLDLVRRFRALRPGETVRVEVERGGRRLVLSAPTWPNLSPSALAALALPALVLLAMGVGVFLVRRQATEASLFLLFCLTSAVNDAGQATLPAGGPLAVAFVSAVVLLGSLPSAALLLHLSLVFPSPGRLQSRLRPLLPVAYAVPLLAGAAVFLPFVLPGPGAFLASSAVRGPIRAAFDASVVASYTLAAASFLVQVSRATAERARQQARLLFFALALLLAARVLLREVPLHLEGRVLIGPVGLALLDLVLPAFVAFAIVRHHLFDIDVFVRHGLVYTAASVTVAGVFVGTMAFLGEVVKRLTPGSEAVPLAAAAALAAILFHPLRVRVQDGVDRLFYRKRYDTRRALGESAERISSLARLHEAAAYLRARVEVLLVPEWTEVFVRRGEPPAWERVGAAGEVEALLHPGEAAALEALLAGRRRSFAPDTVQVGRRCPALAVPVTRDGSLLGALLLGPRRGDGPYLPEDSDALSTLASLAGPVFERGLLLEERALTERLAAVGGASSALLHELKNPLAAIQSTAAVLRRRLPGDARGRELTEVIEGEAQRLHEAAAQVLSFVKPGAVAERGRVALAPLLQALAAAFQPSFEAGRVTVDVEVPARTAVEGDPGQLRRLFLNLLLNAREAMPAGGRVRLSVSDLPSPDGPRLAVRVEDDGPGFSPEVLERPFVPFRTTKRLGTGLGLPNVRRAAEEHGAEVFLENRPEGGARVTVLFPSTATIPT
jgi:signal transduction histidine kinase